MGKQSKANQPAASISRVNGRSRDIPAEKKAALGAIFPEVFTEGKIDFNRLKTALGELVETNGERYGLSWAGKNDCFRHIQEPTSATLRAVRKESVEFDRTKNLFIEGDNLQVLKVLQQSYYGAVKMIYIDPPYNTGSDSFIYPDRFTESQQDYLKRIGDKDAEGNLIKDGFWRKNSKDAGHFHSNWLSMMYPRLFLARNLLRQDGVIFVSIDDNEVHNLRMIMNEIFGEENFVANIVWRKKYSPQNDAKYFSDMHDHILLYAKSKEIWSPLLLPRTDEQNSAYKNPDNDPRGPWKATDATCNKTKSQRPNLFYPVINPKGQKIYPSEKRVWVLSRELHEQMVKENKVWWGADENNKIPAYKTFLSEVQDGMVPTTIWDYQEAGHNQLGKQELNALIGSNVFDTPKPVALMERMLQISTTLDGNDIVLDFFSGSCTTAHAVMQLNAEDGGNRRFICVQVGERCEEDSEARKAGFKTIAEIGKERIRRAAKKIRQEADEFIKSHKKAPGLFEEEDLKAKIENLKSLDLGFKVFKLDESNFKQWRSDVTTPDALERQMFDFIDNVKPGANPENILIELILKEGLDLNVSVEQQKVNASRYFRIDGGRLIICLEDKITKKLIGAILKEKPAKALCLDRAFENNDQLKTNTLLQMEAEKIEFKVI